MNYVTQSSSNSPPRVLVVDDDPVFRRLAVARLEPKLGGTYEAHDGMEAWHLLKRGDFNLALVDLDMPNMNGYALMRCVRTYSATQRMALIVVTGHDDLATVQRAFQAGATGFLTKPVNWSMFLPYIKHLLDLARAAEAAETRSQSQAQKLTMQAEIHGLIAEVSNTEMRSRAGRIAATANQALNDPAAAANPELLANALKVARDEANAQHQTVETLEPYAALLATAAHQMSVVHALDGLIDAVKTGCESAAAERLVTIALPEMPQAGIRCPREIFIRCATDMLAFAISKAPGNTQVRLHIALEANRMEISATGQGLRPERHMMVAPRTDGDCHANSHPPPSPDPFEIGLAMSHRLAGLMGGQVEVVPNEHGQDGAGQPGTVRLSLPDVLVQRSTPRELAEQELVTI